ncbi:(2Fe-2S)-binding protein [Paenarthrobacter ilicis]|uniref:(2Fe-2S)-binding protein n=1 Tax=Paenarthrobacter ilicis TaxID=43665 RepID=UPI0028D7F32B|nr:(2Fe-2S)-binding protein [Paenarthrobacter ilicis]
MQLQFDGRDIEFRPGQTIQGALAAAGILATRTTRITGTPRGMFCGIGVCFDCLTEVDGQPNQRSCLVPAEDGMTVTTQKGASYGDLEV